MAQNSFQMEAQRLAQTYVAPKTAPSPAGISCDQCEALMIDGVFCHETGCPNERKYWDGQEWVMRYQCWECENWHDSVEEASSCCREDYQDEDEETV